MLRHTALLAALIPCAATAQVLCALGSGAISYKAAEDERPTADALEITARANAAGKTICQSNCPQVVLFRNSTAPNLMLRVDAGRAKVVYAPQTFNAIYDRYGDPGVLALMTHALGHAIDDAIGASWIEKGWSAELRADAWAGCMLARSNLSPADGQAALAALAEYPSPSHPAWAVRLPVLRAGFTHCGGTPPPDPAIRKKDQESGAAAR